MRVRQVAHPAIFARVPDLTVRHGHGALPQHLSSADVERRGGKTRSAMPPDCSSSMGCSERENALMWETIIGGVVSGAVSGFAAGWFASSRQNSKSTAGRDAPAASVGEGGTVMQASGDGVHRQAARDFIENPGPPSRPNLRIDVRRDKNASGIYLTNIGNVGAEQIEFALDADRALVRLTDPPESLDAGHEASLGFYTRAFQSGTPRATVNYTDGKGQSYSTTRDL